MRDLGQILLEEVHHRAAASGFRRGIHALVRDAVHMERISRALRSSVSSLRVVREGAFRMNITEILQRQAEQFPDEIAIIDRVGRRHSPNHFCENSTRRSGGWRLCCGSSGLKAGDTVLLFHPMSSNLYIALAAILRGGMTAMFVDPSAGRQYIDRCCELLPPQALIASSKAHLLRLLSPALRRIPIKWSIGGQVPFTRSHRSVRLNVNDDRNVHPCNPETPALASFTSGSTGQPKAAIRTHGFLLAQHRAVEESFSLATGEVELVTLPIFVLANLASRVTSVIADADLRRPSEIVAGARRPTDYWIIR